MTLFLRGANAHVDSPSIVQITQCVMGMEVFGRNVQTQSADCML